MNTCSMLHKYSQFVQIGNNTLQYRHGYAIMLPDLRKEMETSDLYARRRILHSRRVIRDPQNRRGLSYTTLAHQEAARIQGCRFLENQQSGVSRVLGKKEKYTSRRSRQKIKLVDTSSVEQIVAVRLPLQVLADKEDNLGTSYKQCAYFNYRQETNFLSTHKKSLWTMYRRVATRNGARLFMFFSLVKIVNEAWI